MLFLFNLTYILNIDLTEEFFFSVFKSVFIDKNVNSGKHLFHCSLWNILTETFEKYYIFFPKRMLEIFSENN